MKLTLEMLAEMAGRDSTRTPSAPKYRETSFPKSLVELPKGNLALKAAEYKAWEASILVQLSQIIGALNLPCSAHPTTYTRYKLEAHRVYKDDGRTETPGSKLTITTSVFLFGTSHAVEDYDLHSLSLSADNGHGTGVLHFRCEVTVRDSDDKIDSYGNGVSVSYIDGEERSTRIEYSNHGTSCLFEVTEFTELVRLIRATGQRLSDGRTIRQVLDRMK